MLIKKILCVFLFLVCLFFGINVRASNTNLVLLGGDAIGIDVQSHVTVIGFYGVNTEDGKVNPWEKSDIKENDIIISIDGINIGSIEDVSKAIEGKTFVSIKLQRGNEYVYTGIEVVPNERGKGTIGLYLKDKILGVGTLTFINPTNKKYAALGHGVQHGKNNGKLLSSSISYIKKASPGTPGEKQALLTSIQLGTITKNNDIGIFGEIRDDKERKVIEVAKASSVKTGKAQIATVINKDKIEFFDIEIIEVKKQTSKDTKGIKVRITDERLINATGGIIQGMSGSPIIQDNKLVGALSHVIVSSPTLGYGVFAEWMYEECK